jgi:hypothetical protein
MTSRLADDDRDPAAPILDYLRDHLTGYPFRLDLDAAFVDELLDDFDELDVLEQIKRLRWYRDDAPLDEHSKPRLAIRRWLVNAQRRSR